MNFWCHMSTLKLFKSYFWCRCSVWHLSLSLFQCVCVFVCVCIKSFKYTTSSTGKKQRKERSNQTCFFSSSLFSFVYHSLLYASLPTESSRYFYKGITTPSWWKSSWQLLSEAPPYHLYSLQILDISFFLYFFFNYFSNHCNYKLKENVLKITYHRISHKLLGSRKRVELMMSPRSANESAVWDIR